MGTVILTGAADQASKRLAEHFLPPHEYIPIVGRVLGWYLAGGRSSQGTANLLFAFLLLPLVVVGFWGVWRGGWGYLPAVAALGILLGGIVSTFASKYWLRTDFQFVRINPIVGFGINLAVLTSVGGGLSLILMALTGRFPKDPF